MLSNKISLPIAFLALIIAILLWRPESQAPTVTFTMTNGDKIAMSTLKGKVVLINFWATDCKSCVDEMPKLINIYNQYKSQDFELIAVTMSYDPPAQLSNFLTQQRLPFPVMHDGFGEISKQFGRISVTPTAILFDKNGRQLLKRTGALDFIQLEALLEQQL